MIGELAEWVATTLGVLVVLIIACALMIIPIAIGQTLLPGAAGELLGVLLLIATFLSTLMTFDV
jgi:hypothetical protein